MRARTIWPAALLVLTGCATTRVAVPPSAPPRLGAEERGQASWYGEPFHGRRTSSGEVFNMYQLTAAHRTLPLGTRVRVTHLGNGRSVEVRINDRGPFVGGRIIDVSYAAAQRLSAVGAGVFPVRLRVVALPDSAREPPGPRAEPARVRPAARPDTAPLR
jgi:rare lipoprotein A